MDLDFSNKERAFRERVRHWLAENAPSVHRPFEGAEAAAYDQAWQRRLYTGGFAGITWPAAYGGAGLSPIELLIWFDELGRANAPHPGAMGIALNHAGPTLIVRGSEPQKLKYLKPILTGETIWCQGFSESGAGSDLAALTTGGEIVGNDLVVNGQKMWTSNAQHARYQELLVRTDRESKRHHGLTWVICDMSSAGIDIKPIKNMMGEHHVNMMFYDNVKIPVENVVGGVDNGWSVAMSTLSFERAIYFLPEMMSMARKVESVRELATKIRLDNGELAIDDRTIARRIAHMKAKALSLRSLAVSVAGGLSKEGQPGPEGSMVKLYVTTTYKELASLAGDIMGWNFLDYGEDRTSNRWTYDYLWSWVLTISGGSSEIQREIIADQVLQLPRAR